ncbi:MAG TPA: penicillin-binding protein 2 [Azospirillaceae bacterium]|nr:penicillin-binding protein 2 [Azospirillaceae bacterium]
MDSRDQDRYRLFTRRALVLGGMKLGILGGLAARLYYLQVVESEHYTMLAEDNRIALRLIAPSRGLITDSVGEPLAVNDQNFRVVITAEQAKDAPRVLRTLADLIGLSEAEIARVLRDIRRRRRFVPVNVKENLTWEQVAAVEVNAPELPGVSIDVGEVRRYPLGPATAHVLGYVGAVAESELTGDPVLALPGFKIGKGGVERLHDLALRGTAGTSHLEVNAVGRVIRELRREEGRSGREIRLTLDAGLQRFTQERLAQETSAAAVVMDVHTGGIYAFCSSPSFDPNDFTGGISAERWLELTTDPTKPMVNKVSGGEFAPGSTFKMIVGLAALEAGLIHPRATIGCPGHMVLGEHRFHCWKKGGHGALDMIGAIRESCDVYFYELARRMGVDRIHEMSLRFGLGQKTEIDLPGEKPGLIPSRQWKLGRFGVPWQGGESLVASIGQGYVLATPLQLAVMTARLVNGGFAVKPHLTKQIQDGPSEQTSWPSVGVQRQHLDLMVQAMNAVVLDPRGTAHKARAMERGMEFGGKTGTSQVRRITMAERERGVRKNEELPWRERDHALFVGYGPVQAPRYAVSVLVEHGGGGSTVAAPIARDILIEAQKRNSAHGAPAAPSPSAEAGPVRRG